MSETPDQAKTRRRWLSLAEMVGVAGVLIAALTLWLGWANRHEEVVAKQAETSAAARDRARVDLTATVAEGGRTLRIADARHDLRDLRITFPAALGVGPQRPAEMAIDATWIAEPLLRLTDGGTDARTGRLPVLLAVDYWDGDAVRTATGLYDIVWRTEGRVLRGRALTLEALRLRARGGDQAGLDAAWSHEKP